MAYPYIAGFWHYINQNASFARPNIISFPIQNLTAFASEPHLTTYINQATWKRHSVTYIFSCVKPLDYIGII